MHEEGDHATKNQLSGSLLQGDGLEKRLEQWECILHDQHGRLLLQGLANGPLHHHLAQIRRKEEAPPLSPHTSKKRNFKINILGITDDAKCYEMVRQLRWPDGVHCPHLRSWQNLL